LQLSLNSNVINHSEDPLKQIQEQDTQQNINDNLHNQTIKKISLITKGQKPYIKRILNDIFNNSIENAEKVCDFIIAEKNEINIKESTVEWHVKVLGQLLKYHYFKNFKEITKTDILDYLYSLRKSSIEDPTNESVGTFYAIRYIKFILCN
jgi:transposase